jgi:hypothetical protein
VEEGVAVRQLVVGRLFGGILLALQMLHKERSCFEVLECLNYRQICTVTTTGAQHTSSRNRVYSVLPHRP